MIMTFKYNVNTSSVYCNVVWICTWMAPGYTDVTPQ